MSSVKSKSTTPSRSSSKQQPLKFVVKTKNVNEVPGPFLATFGALPALESIDPTGENPLLFNAFAVEKKQLATKNAPANDNNVFNQQYILKGETEKVEYSSTKSDSARANQSKYLIGIFDPSKNEVELVPTPGIFVMQQAAKNVKLFFETQEEDTKKRNARTLQVFGASGAKALAKRMTLDSLQEGSGNVTEGMVTDLRQQLAGNLENEKEGTKRDAFLDLPSPNIHTENVQEVYDPLKLIPESIWSVIPRVAGNIATKVQQHSLHPEAAKLMERMQAQKSSLPTKILKERLIVYAALLGGMTSERQRRSWSISALALRYRLQRPMAEHILNTFSAADSSGTFLFGPFAKAKCMLYATTAVLLAFDLSLDQELVDAIGQIIKASPEEMKVLLTRIGCTITKTGAILEDPWKVWKKMESVLDPIEVRLNKATHRALEREKANKMKNQKEAKETGDLSAVDVEEAEEKEFAQGEEEEPSNMNDDEDEAFVSGTKGADKKKRSRKSIGEKAKEDPLNKKKKM